MKWLLIFTALAPSHDPTPQSVEFDTKEECQQIGPALLDLVQRVSDFRGSVACHNPETGEKVEIKIPPR